MTPVALSAASTMGSAQGHPIQANHMQDNPPSLPSNPQTKPGRTTLGISANTVHKPKLLKRKSSTPRDRIEYRRARYNLQRVAQSLLYNRDAMKQHRTCNCCRDIASDGVPIYRTVDGNDARFGNLLTCGSVWACPVCSAKITEKRRGELQKGINTWSKDGGKVMLMTLTFPHEFDMPLGEGLEKFAKALRAFKNSRSYRNLLKERGWEGSVRSLEVTYGGNGWHPHTHELVFVENDELLDNVSAMDELRHEWIKQLLKNGLGDHSKLNDMLAYGLDMQGGDYAAEYVAKFGHEPKLFEDWTAAHELTKSHSKIGGGGHATPFMLLQWYAESGDEAAGAKFREYAEEFQGKRMLFWSHGLKKRLLGTEEEISDEELAAQEDSIPEEELVCRITFDEWKLVIGRNARGELLMLAAKMGKEGVRLLLDDLPNRTMTHSEKVGDWQRRRFFY